MSAAERARQLNLPPSTPTAPQRKPSKLDVQHSPVSVAARAAGRSGAAKRPFQIGDYGLKLLFFLGIWYGNAPCRDESFVKRSPSRRLRSVLLRVLESRIVPSGCRGGRRDELPDHCRIQRRVFAASLQAKAGTAHILQRIAQGTAR